MKVVDKMNAAQKAGETFFSFEFFPPRTEEVSLPVMYTRSELYVQLAESTGCYAYAYRGLKTCSTGWTVWQRMIRPSAISPGEPAALQLILPCKLLAKCKTWCVKVVDSKLLT